ncbi:MAG: sigma-70 family RNA polymerase sigma factor [Acidobacteriota bacterium]
MTLVEPAAPPAVAKRESDVELVVRARAGDAEAQATLAERHRQPIFFLALQLMGNRDDAMDVAQEALLRFFKTLHRFDCRRPVRPWLFQIVRNRVVDLYRRKKVRRHDSLDATDHDGNPYLVLRDHSVDPERDATRSELRVRILGALDELSQIQREILVLRDYQDLSYNEIAETLNIPIGTVMSRLHGARKRLRQTLQDDLHDLPRA